MRGFVIMLPVLLAAAALTGCSDALPGSYVGDLDLNRSASLTVAFEGGEAQVKRFSGGQHTDGASVVVRSRGEGYRVEMPGCAFDAERDPAQKGMRIATPQSCTVELDGQPVEFALSGGGRVDGAEGLSLTIDGAAATKGASGGLSWTFSGKKR